MPVPMKAASSTAAASALRGGIAEAEGQWHGGVEQEVERDIEESATVGRSSPSRATAPSSPSSKRLSSSGTIASQILPMRDQHRGQHAKSQSR